MQPESEPLDYPFTYRVREARDAFKAGDDTWNRVRVQRTKDNAIRITCVAGRDHEAIAAALLGTLDIPYWNLPQAWDAET